METDLRWKSRSDRIEGLRGRSIPNSQPGDPDPSLDNNPSSTLNIEGSTQSSLIVDSWIEKFMDLELYEAATKDDVDGFINVLERVSAKKKLSLPAILDNVSPLGNTLIHVAASYGREETVKLIAYHFPQLLTKQNSKSDTALHIAARAGDKSVVKTLIKFQRDFASGPSSSDNGITVREAARDDLLLRIRNDDGNTALHEALINRQESMAFTLIRADGEVIYYLNKEEKSSLYLAAEAGNHLCLDRMLKSRAPNENVTERVKGKSPVHAAVMSTNRFCLRVMLYFEPRFIHLRDKEGRTPLHCAASIGNLWAVRYLLQRYPLGAFERDANDFFPIHMASIEGHVDVFQELLRYCPINPRELLGPKDQNILHVAAKNGKHKVVSYILKTHDLNILINDKDADGNTPLHLATMACHPRIVTALTWDKRVNLNLKNKESLTAFDAAEKYMERIASFQQRLTWTALRTAGASSDNTLNTNTQTGMRLEPPNRQTSMQLEPPNRQTSMQLEPPNMDNYKDRVNTLLLVSTLVATITFAAGFTMPGGYNNSDPDQGIATMLRHKIFFMFVFCDAIAMYSSIVVVVTLIWAQLSDTILVHTALRLALPLLGIALTMMSLAFMAGVYLVVSKLSQLANVILIMGLVFLVALSTIFFPLLFLFSSSHRILSSISYYFFCLRILVMGRCTDCNLELG